MNLWEFIYPMKRITKPIRLIELFAGIGSQFKALKVLTKNVESYKICEWAYNSYCSYNAIHIKDYKDYSNGLTKEQLINKVKGTSLNYNEPMTDKQLASKPLEWLKNAYNNIVATHNLVNIMEIQGKDLEIVDTDKYEYIMTYSFPCQDLSLAGKRLGMGVSQKQGGTRSGLLWEVERILDELDNKPQILLMENVPEVIGEKNIDDFHKWENKLEQLGYKNYVEILNAKDYGIPQNRKRCFMVSVLGEYAYNFAGKQKLHLKLKDMLEEQVDEKYYLSKKQINQISQWNSYENPLDNVMGQDSISPTITTRIAESQDGGINASMKVYSEDLQNNTNIRSECQYSLKNLNETLKNNENIQDGDFIDGYNRNIKKNVAGTITTGVSSRNNTFIAIKNATQQGYLEATEGDGIDISTRMQYHRGTVQKGKAQTITCMGGDNVGVVVKDEEPKIKNNLRIRKLTPLETMRLMGFDNQDYKAMREINMSDMAIYHMAGDSIVVCVLIAIFYPLLFNDNNYKEIINNYIDKEIVEKGQEKNENN